MRRKNNPAEMAERLERALEAESFKAEAEKVRLFAFFMKKAPADRFIKRHRSALLQAAELVKARGLAPSSSSLDENKIHRLRHGQALRMDDALLFYLAASLLLVICGTSKK